MFSITLLFGEICLTVLSNIWLMFIALSLTARDNEHIALNLIYEKLPNRTVAIYTPVLETYDYGNWYSLDDLWELNL